MANSLAASIATGVGAVAGVGGSVGAGWVGIGCAPAQEIRNSPAISKVNRMVSFSILVSFPLNALYQHIKSHNYELEKKRASLGLSDPDVFYHQRNS